MEVQKYTENYSGNSQIFTNGSPSKFNHVRGNHYIYLPNANYTFVGGIGQIYYCSTLNGSYSQVASLSTNTLYKITKSGYYRLLGGDTTFSIYGLNNSSVNIVNDLPKVTILSETTKTGSTTHGGNKLTISSGTTIFKPTITCNMTYDCGASLILSRSTAQNGTYTQLSKYSVGTNGKHTSGSYNSLTSSYYYKLDGANSYVYLKDTAGSAVRF